MTRLVINIVIKWASSHIGAAASRSSRCRSRTSSQEGTTSKVPLPMHAGVEPEARDDGVLAGLFL